jgi:hypothetical protein
VSAIAQDHEIITERELARLEADGWRNTSPEGRGLWVGAGWMVRLRRSDGGLTEERTVIVAVDEELADQRIISGDDVDGAHSGISPAYHPRTTQPQRNAGTPDPEPIPARPLWHTALLVVAVWVVVLGVCMLIGGSMIGGLL